MKAVGFPILLKHLNAIHAVDCGTRRGLCGADCSQETDCEVTPINPAVNSDPSRINAKKREKEWGDRWDSNPRQPEPQSGTLPTELRSPPHSQYRNNAKPTPSSGAPGRTRTCNHRLRRPMLYPIELRAHGAGSVGRGRGIRTPDILLPKQARYQTALYPVLTSRFLRFFRYSEPAIVALSPILVNCIL